MRFPTFSKFLCCINLETGISLIGWLSIVYNCLGLGLLAFLWITHGDKEIIEFVENYCEHVAEVLKHFHEVSIYRFLVYIAYALARIYAAARLLNSLKTRNHRDTIAYLGFKAFAIISLVISIFFHTNEYFVIFMILIFCLNSYCFACVFSLYDKLQSEYFGRVRLVDEESPYHSVL